MQHEKIEMLSPIGLFNKSVFPTSNKYGTSEQLPYYALYSDKIVCYSIPPGNNCHKNVNIESIKNLEKANKIGLLSKANAKKIQNIVNLWSNSIIAHNELNKTLSKKQRKLITFVTLTLSSKQMHDDNFIKKNMLFRFIENLQEFYEVEHYLWRAERQKNGNIHFHILIDKFIPHQRVRYLWNLKQKSFGYLQQFAKNHKHENPNSTDIQYIDNMNKVSAYCAKYISKHKVQDKIQGHVFGCSPKLRNLTPYINLLDSHIAACINDLVKKNLVECYAEEYFSVIRLKNFMQFQTVSSLLSNLLNEQNIMNYASLYLDDEVKPITSKSANKIQTSCEQDVSTVQTSFIDLFKSEALHHFDTY